MTRPHATLASAVGALCIAGVLGVPAAARADTTDACIQASDEGQVLRDQGKLLAARARFLTCSRDTCPRIVRADCTTWLADADARIPSVVLSARDGAGRDIADVKVTLDGRPLADHLEARAVQVDPGQHRFVFERPGARSIEETVILREGELRRAVAVRFDAAPPPSPPRPAAPAGPTRGTVAATVTLGALALVGGGLFAYLAATAKSDTDHLRSTCAPGCNPADVDAIRAKLIGANVSLGVGIASAAAAIGVAVWGPREAAPAAALVPLPGGGFLSVRARF